MKSAKEKEKAKVKCPHCGGSCESDGQRNYTCEDCGHTFIKSSRGQIRVISDSAAASLSF